MPKQIIILVCIAFLAACSNEHDENRSRRSSGSQASCSSKKCMAGFGRHNSYISSAER